DRLPRILWVDDDEIFLKSVKRALTEHDIVVARTASEAEARLTESSVPPMLVFCDLMLPDRSGHELHYDIAQADAELARRFVFVTGGVITPEVADYLIASGCPTLLKPL